jgi:glycosyltransferase involved in cell wall biosynthesis
MRIGILHNYSLSGSGSSTYVLGLVKALLSQGDEVVVISREPDYASLGIFGASFVHNGSAIEPVPGHSGPPASGSAVGYTLTFEPYIGIETHSECQGRPTFTTCSPETLQEFIARTVNSVVDIARRENLSVIHANHVVPLPFIAAQVKRQIEVPFVVTLHGSHIEYVLAKDPHRYRPYAEAGLRDAGRVIVTTEAVQRRCMAYTSLTSDRFVQIPVGVDTTLFKLPEPAEEGSAVRVYDHVSGNHVALRTASHLIIFVGKVIGDKGTHLLPFILGKVKTRISDARIVIVGGGPLFDSLVAFARGTCSAEDLYLLAAAEGFGAPGGKGPEWEQRCRNGLIMVGPQPPPTVQELLRVGDVCVIPSVIDEALPMVVLEAVSSGTMPVARDYSGFREVVAHVANAVPEIGRAGIVAGDTQDLVTGFGDAVIASIGKIDGNRERILAGLRRLAVEHYDWRAIARRIKEHYKLAIAPLA